MKRSSSRGRWRSAGIAALATGSVATAVFAVAGPAAIASAAPLAKTVQVIVRTAPGQTAGVEQSVRQAGGHIGLQLTLIDGFVARMSASGVAALSGEAGVVSVTPDSSVQLMSVSPASELATAATPSSPLGYNPTTDDGSLYAISKAIGAQTAWAEGITGAGVDVALLDTGVVPVSGLDEPGKVINGPDLSFDSQNTSLHSLDTFGHGTHMAGIIAGRDDNAVPGQYANPSTWTGIAPDAGIVNVKLGGTDGTVDVSQIIAGIDWVVDNAHSNGLNIKVMNLSLGTNSVQPYTLDPLDYATEMAWHHGIVVVAAAGNDGTASAQLADPADDPFVIAVGAEDLQTSTAATLVGSIPIVGGLLSGLLGALTGPSGSAATFDNTGTSARHVDLLAPGTHVLSLKDPGSAVDSTYPSAEVGTRFFRGSGTSQATAVVSGAVALLAQRFPSATPDQIKYMLTHSAQLLPGTTAVNQGSGVIRVDRAILFGLPLPSLAAQAFAPGTGLGTLEGARGGNDLTVNGVTLSGEHDIFGNPWNPSAWAAKAATASTWTGGLWNGATWIGPWSSLWTGQPAETGSGGVNWSSLRWGSNTWSDIDWSSLRWGSLRWGSNTWS